MVNGPRVVLDSSGEYFLGIALGGIGSSLGDVSRVESVDVRMERRGDQEP